MPEEGAIDRIERKLPHYDRGKPRIRAALTPAAEEIDRLEQTFVALRDAWYVSTAKGEALDNIAARWGLTRYRDENDERLRDRVRREIKTCLQNATVEDLKEVLQWWLGWDAKAVRIYVNYSPTLDQEKDAFFEVQVPISWLARPQEINFRFSADPDDSTFNSEYGFNRGTWRLPVEPFLEYPVNADELLDRVAAAGVKFLFGVYGGFRFSLDPDDSTFESDFGFNAGKFVGIVSKGR